MSFHVKDLLALNVTCPAVYDEFVKGNFVTQKSQHKFSALAHDQVHEQLNAMVKGDGGVIGITENEAALKRWMVAGPEVARLFMGVWRQALCRQEMQWTTSQTNT